MWVQTEHGSRHNPCGGQGGIGVDLAAASTARAEILQGHGQLPWGNWCSNTVFHGF